MARKPTKARSRKKAAKNRKKRMGRPGAKPRKAMPMAARKAVRRSSRMAARKPARRKAGAAKRRKSDHDSTINTLVIMLIILIALGSGWLYQHKMSATALAPPPATAMEKK